MVKQTKVYHAYVEGKQEEMYLKHLENLINSVEDRKYNIKIVVKNANGGSPLSIVKKAANDSVLQIDEKLKNGKAALFDYDQKEPEFIQAIKICQSKKVCSAYSIVNFDLWIILHKKEYSKKVESNLEYQSEIIRLFRLKKDAKIKNKQSIEKILKQINLDDILNAIKRAEKIEQTNKNDNNIMCNNPLVYGQPNLEIYKYIKSILEGAKINI